MGRLFTTRRSEWIPGIALLAAAAGITALLGVSLGISSWAVHLGVFLLLLLGYGWGEAHVKLRAEQPPAPRPRGSLKLIKGGKTAYDLENDDSTEDQKYLM